MISTDNLIFVWGIGPVVSYILGYTLATVPLEILLRYPWAQAQMITYSSESRPNALKRTQLKISLWTQIRGVALTLFGPTAIVNGVVGYFLLTNLCTIPPEFPNLMSAFFQFVIMELVGDFSLYWGHRVQHEVEFLWQFHKLHHSLETPSPIGTLYIHSVDATLQGAIPILFAILAAKPHPMIAYCYIALRIAENVVNHSGLDSFWIDLVCLKFLPGRASIKHHDAHHKYSNYSRNAKNYGENFWIWDILFNTYRQV